MYNILVTGVKGQLGSELQVLASDFQDYEFFFTCASRLDITEYSAVRKFIEKNHINCIINCAAYTAVDKAETEVKTAEKVNTLAPKYLAEVAKDYHCKLVHISTDYVFDGNNSRPYVETDIPNPQSVYGITKLQGEKYIQEINPKETIILRTSWVYSKYGNNFVKTMLRLMSEKPQLSVIDDQIGTPTWAKGLAEACVLAAENKTAGVYHWTDEGVASWYDFAMAIQELGIEKGLLSSAITVLPIPSSQYPTPAKRPHYSVLDKQTAREVFTSCKPAHWRKQLSDMLDDLKA